MIIAHHGTSTMHCNLLTDIRIAKETGYEGIDIFGAKLYRYLDQGFTVESLLPELEDLPPVALGFVQDIERQEPQQYEALLQECEKMCSVAEQLGCPSVQLLPGPIGPGVDAEQGYGGLSYQGLMGRLWPEVRDLTAKNLRVLSGIGKKHNVKFHLEPLTWAPLHTLRRAVEVIDCAEVDNVAIVLDFWHLWTSGVTPEDIAKLDQKLIRGIHLCDSLPLTGGPVKHNLREVWTGAGHIPLKEWVDAATSTGFDGWMSPELFSPKHWEMDPWRVAYNLGEMMRFLLV